MTLLDVQTLAILENISPRAVRKKIQGGAYVAVETVSGERGRNGINYRIPLNSLNDDLKMKYYGELIQAPQIQNKHSIALDSVPDYKVKQMDHKMQVLEAWWQFERDAKDAGSVTGRLIDDFIIIWNTQHKLDKPIKRSTLYSWESKAKGRNKQYGLVDQRGGHNKGDMVIEDDLWSKFLQLFLTDSKKSMKLCYDFLEMQYALKQIVIPSYSTFKTQVTKRIPKSILCKYREGETAYKQKYLTYVLRDPSNLKANQWWVADHRRLDVMVRKPNGKTYRPWITSYMDVRTRRMVGTVMSENPNADTILLCFRKAVKRFGLPEDVYVDNGRDFCALDMVGSSNRWQNDIQPSLMRDLEINMHFSIPREPSGKTIERAFLTVKQHFDRCFSTFCGGNTAERPEALNDRLKTDDVISESEMRELIDQYFEYWHNERPHSGIGMNGKSPRILYDELAKDQPKRMLTEAQLRYLLVRTEKKRKVGRDGLELFEGMYYSDDLHHMRDQYVFAKYDPEDLSYVYIYDVNNLFQCMALRKGVANFANDEVTKTVIREVRSERKRAKRIDAEWVEKNRREAAEPNDIKRFMETAKAIKELETEGTVAEVSNVIQLMPNIGKDIQKIKKAEEQMNATREDEVVEKVVGARQRGIQMAEMMRMNEYLAKRVTELERD